MKEAVPVKGKRWLRVEPRYTIVLACFLATFTAYVERVGFSIAFTGMAKEANIAESLKGTVLSAFYWGYGLSQVHWLAFIVCSAFNGFVCRCSAAVPLSPASSMLIIHLPTFGRGLVTGHFTSNRNPRRSPVVGQLNYTVAA
jgi:sugar phosphate permease